jgi:lycopene beta-cyclase
MDKLIIHSISKQILKHFDYIIAGGGASGLSLAYYLLHSPLKHSKILIVDVSEKKQNDRTWCFWGNHDLPFNHLISNSWDELAFADDEGEMVGFLQGMSYHMIRGIDFYQHMHEVIDAAPNCERLIGRISTIGSSADQAHITVNGERITADWVFNSSIKPAIKKRTGGHYLLQHFYGWRIKSDRAVFNPGRAMLMDFRADQDNDTRFFYVLPFSETEALVEYTIFSADLLAMEEYQVALEDYIKKELQIDQYEIKEVESGAIPMTDHPINFKHSERVINMGTVGGAVKPSTGYAFLRIQEQAKQIVKQLVQGQRLDSSLKRSARFRFYDRLLLNILQEEGYNGKRVFCQLFHRNKMQSILKFLAERSNIFEEARIFASLPTGIFLASLYRAYVKVKSKNSFLITHTPVRGIKRTTSKRSII